MSDGSTQLLMARRAAGDPTRQRIVRLFHERPRWTAKELGRQLGVDPNRLYYHLRIMTEARLIEVVDTRASGRMVERVFGAKDLSQRITWSLSEPEEFAAAVGAILDAAKADAQDAVFEAAASENPTAPDLPIVMGPAFYAPTDDAAALFARVQELVTEFRDRARAAAAEQGAEIPEGWRRLSFTYSIVTRPPLQPPEQGE